ncbi:hypothetical protein MtrunA17_Chr6g0465061 [Medicago truncatula]|uniref:Uncharacterized protein n=1 Tax=Medicago truncatula TaxID=3880 RepID=A0A396HCS5_MEDTR|nr:hypothetical protein MtrunA17_Chr6g0465061 [Medicago truncatula]
MLHLQKVCLASEIVVNFNFFLFFFGGGEATVEVRGCDDGVSYDVFHHVLSYFILYEDK